MSLGNWIHRLFVRQPPIIGEAAEGSPAASLPLMTICGDDGFVYCLESAGFLDGHLGIRGWALHEREVLKSIELIATLPDGKTIPLAVEQGLPRDDVARAVPQSPDALYSGFSASTHIASAQEVRISNKMQAGNSIRLFDLGSIENVALSCPADRRSGVLVLTERTEGACRRYRAEHLAEQLSRQGVDACVADITQLSPRHGQYKHLVLQRTHLHACLDPLINHFRAGNGATLFELDDALFDYEYMMQNDHLRLSPLRQSQNAKTIGALMRSSDGLITTTLPLMQLMQSEFPDKPVFLNPNVANEEMLALSQAALDEKSADDGHIRLGYFSGSPTHNRDFAELLAPLLRILADDERVRLRVVGDIELPDELASSFPERIERMEHVGWQELPSLIAHVDINLLPLENTQFNECKSAIKWMEAALVGVPTIASRNREMERVIDDGVTGLLCSDETQWGEALRSLVADGTRRNAIAAAARAEALAHHTTSTMNDELLALLRN